MMEEREACVGSGSQMSKCYKEIVLVCHSDMTGEVKSDWPVLIQPPVDHY